MTSYIPESDDELTPLVQFAESDKMRALLSNLDKLSKKALNKVRHYVNKDGEPGSYSDPDFKAVIHAQCEGAKMLGLMVQRVESKHQHELPSLESYEEAKKVLAEHGWVKRVECEVLPVEEPALTEGDEDD